MKVSAIIQARLGSTRLPNKILLDLEGASVLARVIQRVQASTQVDEVVVASTENEEDKALSAICQRNNIEIYYGSENDVLDRFYQVAKRFNMDHIVRITADCPFIDPKIVDAVVSAHIKESVDYTSNTLKETYPDGEDVEIFTFAALEKAWKGAKLKSEREHVTSFIRNKKSSCSMFNVENSEDLSSKRWTLDCPEDYEFIRVIYKNLYEREKIFGIEDILKFLKLHPELEEINSHIMRNEGYKKSIQNDGIV